MGKVLALDLQGSGFETYARLMSPNEGETGLVLVEAVGRKISAPKYLNKTHPGLNSESHRDTSGSDGNSNNVERAISIQHV